MNILREMTKGGKAKLHNSKRSGSQDLGTATPVIRCEPTVETKKVVFG